jgi:hypothetical protein
VFPFTLNALSIKEEPPDYQINSYDDNENDGINAEEAQLIAQSLCMDIGDKEETDFIDGNVCLTMQNIKGEPAEEPASRKRKLLGEDEYLDVLVKKERSSFENITGIESANMLSTAEGVSALLTDFSCPVNAGGGVKESLENKEDSDSEAENVSEGLQSSESDSSDTDYLPEVSASSSSTETISEEDEPDLELDQPIRRTSKKTSKKNIDQILLEVSNKVLKLQNCKVPIPRLRKQPIKFQNYMSIPPQKKLTKTKNTNIAISSSAANIGATTTKGKSDKQLAV